MAARHKSKGGISYMGKAGAAGPEMVYAGGSSNVIKEAKARKRGGPCGMKMGGAMAKKRLDRPGRKRGGRVGADTSPLSSAAKYTKLSGETSDYTE